jgi:hypothetical protein
MSEPKVLATLSEPFLKAQNVLGEGEFATIARCLRIQAAYGTLVRSCITG